MSDHYQVDVAVIGSGGAGLSAALAASTHGSRVVVLEKSELLGGTTALSGGGVWVPCHHYQESIGVQDSREEALAYLRAVGPEGWHNVEDPLWVSFVDHAPEMLRSGPLPATCTWPTGTWKVPPTLTVKLWP